MTDTTDYKGTLEEFNACINDPEDGAGYLWDFVKSNPTVFQKALKLADRLQSGMVSVEMAEKGRESMELSLDYVDSIFQAMAAQLLKEIEDD